MSLILRWILFSFHFLHRNEAEYFIYSGYAILFFNFAHARYLFLILPFALYIRLSCTPSVSKRTPLSARNLEMAYCIAWHSHREFQYEHFRVFIRKEFE